MAQCGKFLIYFSIFIITLATLCSCQSGSVIYKDGLYTFSKGINKRAASYGTFTDKIASSGWTYLDVHTNPQDDDFITAYAAGYVEGILTAKYIYMHWKNTVGDYCKQKSIYCQKLKSFIMKNNQWMATQIKHRPHSIYWYHINLTLIQQKGLRDGYHKAMPHKPIDEFSFLLIELSGDLESLETALKDEDTHHVLGSGSCSAFIKVLPDNRDLYFAHDTWTGYQTMLRIYKYYELNFSMLPKTNVTVPGTRISFSSYPGTILSGDDYYLIGSGLATMETTNGNSNEKLWKYVTPSSVLEWIRTIIANRLTSSGNDWVKIFSKYNSGTYNNQWMILDYKLFAPKRPLNPNTLWVLEQIPGKIESADVTNVLKKQGYWASYNVPYFSSIFNMSGNQEQAKKYGNWFTHDKCPRALIFKRDQHKVNSMESLMKLMRYNDFKHDPLSRCNCTPPYSAENAISARSDLNPADGKYNIGALGHRCHGGTDSKSTNYTMFHSGLKSYAIAGPTHEQQPPFRWSTAKFNMTKPLGHPDLFNFTRQLVSWD
ncbi:expressed hypothetical protein [Trichoplax adhaerens]|uniref:Phospholipase B-like n=1 Tax=Trichoplax adhaerens TaxID=10228 RepID=B3RK05_TRIAD|nr:expressed hypothetical protein [Trichoplax adhaerens]EDV28552.1 expressed hypothetical protein [Trichoplax adhaerens]|eukprot:XP_002107754.1 expressed hypothetical protein [Trichoplax adhaerens]